jgi:UDP-3-O-[3-hydroxymyristoyl] glucosamine N-acyltransferase
MSVRLADIVDALGGELIGDGDVPIDHIAAIDAAGPGAITFIAQAKFRDRLAGCTAACVIVAPELREAAEQLGATIVATDPYLYYAKLTQWWVARTRPPPPPGIAPTAVVEEGAHIDPSAAVGPLAFIGARAQIGAGAVIGAHAHVGAQAVVGAHTRLHPRAMLADACMIGERCTVHSGVVIGADGFGFAPGGPDNGNAWVKIEQLGIVRIGNDVDIGANTCIDRGAIGDTLIGNGVKLDNLIQIAHNVQVGDHTAMAAFVGIAGSAKIGAHCMLGGACRIYGHIQIVDHVFVDTCAVISRSILKPGHYSGYFPFDDNATWEKNAATLRHLYTLRERLRALEKRVK